MNFVSNYFYLCRFNLDPYSTTLFRLFLVLGAYDQCDLFCGVQIVLESGEDDSPPGLIMPSGEINWNCPCLGGMAVGPCGVDFR